MSNRRLTNAFIEGLDVTLAAKNLGATKEVNDLTKRIYQNVTDECKLDPITFTGEQSATNHFDSLFKPQCNPLRRVV